MGDVPDAAPVRYAVPFSSDAIFVRLGSKFHGFRNLYQIKDSLNYSNSDLWPNEGFRGRTSDLGKDEKWCDVGTIVNIGRG